MEMLASLKGSAKAGDESDEETMRSIFCDEEAMRSIFCDEEAMRSIFCDEQTARVLQEHELSSENQASPQWLW